LTVNGGSHLRGPHPVLDAENLGVRCQDAAVPAPALLFLLLLLHLAGEKHLLHLVGEQQHMDMKQELYACRQAAAALRL
jgi:hypothetical protein